MTLTLILSIEATKMITVLVVDDVPEIRQVIKDVLEQRG